MEQFKELLLKNVMRILTAEDGVKQIKVVKINKNNGTNRTAFVFDNGSTAASIIYIDVFYKKYLGGYSAVNLASELVGCYRESLIARHDLNIEAVDTILSWEIAKNKLAVCAINEEMNRELLESVPYETVMDIAFIVRAIIRSDEQGYTSTRITNKLLEHFGITKEELFQQAWKNMKSNYPMRCEDMVEIVLRANDYLPESIKARIAEDRGQMFIVTGDKGFQTAAYGFDIESLSKVCEAIGADELFIIPSSVREVIVVGSESVNGNDINETVRAMNNSSEDSEEILSSHCYHYDDKTKTLGYVSTPSEVDS